MFIHILVYILFLFLVFTSAGETVKSTQTLSVTAGDFITSRLENKTPIKSGQVVIRSGEKNNEIKIKSL